MTKCLLARPINGISINSFEVLLDDQGEFRVFASKDEAKELIQDHIFPDSTDEEMEDYFRFLDPEEYANGYEVDITT